MAEEGEIYAKGETVMSMQRFMIEIRVDVKYLEVECSGNTPAMFADEIRKLAREFFKEEIQ